jgi:hypothetical protein
LTDLLEGRLWLDPARADSDGDGLADGTDPAPNARRPNTARGSGAAADDGLVLAALANLWACDLPEPEIGPLRYVTGTEPLEWRGWRGIVLTVPSRDAATHAAGLGYLLLSVDAAADGGGPLAPGERRVAVRFGMPELEGLSMHGYPPTGIVLRRVAGTRWVVTRFEQP